VRPTVEKRYITVPAVERALLAYERAFGMSTPEFYDAYYADDEERIAHIPQRHRSRWATMRRTLDRMTSDAGFADRIERELEHA
jgi:hypothetical protein